MKLYSDIINKDFDEKVKEVNTLEEDLEESLILVEFLPNLLQLCQLFIKIFLNYVPMEFHH